jgi:resuscitation-promoting factor RpfA
MLRALGVPALTLLIAGGTQLAVAAPASAADSTWSRLRDCESGNRYSLDTGNGYYGAYQFDLSTWRAVGGVGYPHRALPAEQDSRARALYSERGWRPWAGCARRLGLIDD